MSELAITGLTKRFKGETALDDVSLTVPEGTTLVLFGPSGAGKTVLLRCVAGVAEPDDGTIRIGSVEMAGVPPERRGIGMALQNFALFPHMSAYDNIASPLVALRLGPDKIRVGVHAVAELLKIKHVLTHPPRALSNGQKQRTALARALAASPSLLLLDDPLRNVDAKLRFEMRLELPRLLAGRGATVVYVTQDYREAMALGDRLAVLSGGRVMQSGTPEDIYLTPASMEVARLFGDPTINLLEVTPEVDGRDLFVRVSDQPTPLDPALVGAVGSACVLGLRPETLRFSDAPDAIPVTIEAEIPFNEKTVTLAATTGGREILLSRPAGTPGPGAGRTRIAIESARALLFDKKTGTRIVPSPGGDREVGAA